MPRTAISRNTTGTIKPVTRNAVGVPTKPAGAIKPISRNAPATRIAPQAGSSVRNLVMTSEEAMKAPRDFIREYQYYDATPPAGKYRRRRGEYKEYNHWGQRKLAIMTIQFFTLHWDPKLHPNPKCLYVGAAPGYTILVMNELFPQIEWHLYDRAEFPESVRTAPNVKIHAKYFDDEDIEKWKNEKSLFFISDIRNPEYGILNQDTKFKWEAEAIVVKDMKMQEKWVFRLDPVSASIKFRLPWIESYYKKDTDAFFPHMQGHVYYQSWVAQTSTEGRFTPVRDAAGKYYSVLWDCKLYEDVFFVHNSKTRTYKFKNPFGEGTVDGDELTADWDSANEVQIWRDFLNKVGLADSQENVQKLSRRMTNLFNETDMSYKTLATIRYTSLDKPDVPASDTGIKIVTEKEPEKLKEKGPSNKPVLTRKKKEEEKEEEEEEESDDVEEVSDDSD